VRHRLSPPIDSTYAAFPARFHTTIPGSTWDLDRGVALSGPLAGRELQELPVTTAYWFAWSAFYPNTAVVD